MRLLRALAGLALLGVLLVVAGASPARADPAKPTDYRSRIDAVSPALPDGVRVDIVGGDAFLRVRVERGHTVTVLDYTGHPYLQFLDDGTVQENTQSEATYLNTDRYGRVDPPSGLDPEGEPQWHTIGHDGEQSWHDHRIHWMSPDRPPGVSTGEVVQTQDVSLVVDGNATAVTVSVVLVKDVSALPAIGIALLVAGAAVVAGWGRHRARDRALPVAVTAALAASSLAVIVGRGERAAVPADAGGSSLVVVVPAVGFVAAVFAALLLARRTSALAAIGCLASAAALAGWAVLRLDVLTHPVLPTDLPFGLDRFGTAVALTAAAAVAALAVHSGAVALAPLADEGDGDSDGDGNPQGGAAP